MRICVTSPSFSVLIKGFPKGFFKGSRGLRQGDPLSPYLFIVVVELLSKLVRKAELCGLFVGFSLNEGSPLVPLIQFADDSLFLLEADMEVFRNLRSILLIVEVVSGLKVNLYKSKLFPMGSVPNIDELASSMGCEVESLPTTYLGLFLEGRPNSKQIWNLILERIEKRLSCWKGRYLSKGGKLVLLRSVLSSLPTYFLVCGPRLQCQLELSRFKGIGIFSGKWFRERGR